MNFIHVADWHIGVTRSFGKGYLERQADALSSLVYYTKETQPDFVIVAGDIFEDHKQVLKAEYELVIETFAQLDSLCQIYVIPGQHDFPSRDSCHLDLIAKLVSHGKLKNTEITLYNTMYCDKLGYKILLIPNSVDIETVPGPSEKVIAVAHFPVAGSVVGAHIMDGSDLPKWKNVVYWALGDIHEQQAVAPNAHYCGSLIQTKFNESYPKGFLHVEIDEDVVVNITPVDVPTKQLIEVDSLDDVPPWVYAKYRGGKFDKLQDIPGNVVSIDLKADTKAPEIPTLQRESLLKAFMDSKGVPEDLQNQVLELDKKVEAREKDYLP